MRIANRTATLCVLAFMALTAAPSLSKADPVTVGGGWVPFTWTTPNSFQNETPFTFTAATSVVLDVTDAFANGDRFEVFNFGSSIGLTSQVNGPAPWAPDADGGWATPNFSKGTFVLGPGSYSLTFMVTQQVLGVPDGEVNQAFFRVNPNPILAEVPEPTSMALLALGGVALAFRRVRRGIGLGKDEEPALAI